MTRRILLGTALSGVLFAAAMLHATGGRPSLPLDDSFIYFRYAERAAAGAPLVYQPGEAPTTGATSLPWTALLALLATLGFDGKAMIFGAMLAGGLLLAVAARHAAATQRALAPRKPGSERPGDLPILGIPLAGALVLLSGPLQWGAWSGMEIGLTAAAVAWAGLEWARTGGRPGPRVAAAGACLALVRPEGALLAAWMPILWIAGAVGGREPKRSLVWGLLPLGAALVPPLAAWALTGDPRSSGFVAKSLLAQPGLDPVDALRIATLRAVGLGRSLLGGGPLPDGVGLYAYGSETASLFVAPGAALLFAIGALPALAREARDRRGGPGTLAIAWLATGLLAAGLLEESDAHFHRYLLPYLPVFLVWVAMGVGRIERVLRETVAGFARLALGIRIGLAVFGLVSVAFFAAAFGDAAADIDRMQIRFGETLAERLDEDDVVAINDAGAIAYFSRRRTLDLVGLTTPGFAGLWADGDGALWEKLESLPPAARPGWFCIFPNWFGFDDLGLLRRVGSVRLTAPAIVDAEKVLYRADWSLAGSGDEPRSNAFGAAARVVDRVDVADVDSERSHGVVLDPGRRGPRPKSFVRRALVASVDSPSAGSPGGGIVDGGRTLFEEISFDLARDSESRVAVVLRTATGLRQRLLVSIDGGPNREVEVYAPGAGRFLERTVGTLPAGSGTSRVRLRVRPEAAGSAPLVLAHVFAVVGETP